MQPLGPKKTLKAKLKQLFPQKFPRKQASNNVQDHQNETHGFLTNKDKEVKDVAGLE